jgi:PhnB protein
MRDRTPRGWGDKIAHARLDIGSQLIAPRERHRLLAGTSMMAGVAEPDRATVIFSALGRQAEIEMPLQATVWSHCFGVCHDRLGVTG